MNFSLKPVFIGWVVLLCQLPLQLFLTFWSVLFLGGMFGKLVGWLFEANVDHSQSAMIIKGILGLFFGGLAFFGIPCIAYFGKKWNYQRTEYKFYDDRLEFEEGFFTINKKVIKYKDIKEVTLRKGFVQRMYNLGTIYLATLATGTSGRTNIFEAIGFGNVSASGVGVRDIQGPDETYEKIKKLVDLYNV